MVEEDWGGSQGEGRKRRDKDDGVDKHHEKNLEKVK